MSGHAVGGPEYVLGTLRAESSHDHWSLVHCQEPPCRVAHVLTTTISSLAPIRLSPGFWMTCLAVSCPGLSPPPESHPPPPHRSLVPRPASSPSSPPSPRTDGARKSTPQTFSREAYLLIDLPSGKCSLEAPLQAQVWRASVLPVILDRRSIHKAYRLARAPPHPHTDGILDRACPTGKLLSMLRCQDTQAYSV